MSENNIYEFSEFQEFIRMLIEKNQSNKIRVDKIKKLLLTGLLTIKLEPNSYKHSEND